MTYKDFLLCELATIQERLETLENQASKMSAIGNKQSKKLKNFIEKFENLIIEIDESQTTTKQG